MLTINTTEILESRSFSPDELAILKNLKFAPLDNSAVGKKMEGMSSFGKIIIASLLYPGITKPETRLVFQVELRIDLDDTKIDKIIALDLMKQTHILFHLNNFLKGFGDTEVGYFYDLDGFVINDHKDYCYFRRVVDRDTSSINRITDFMEKDLIPGFIRVLKRADPKFYIKNVPAKGAGIKIKPKTLKLAR